MGHLVHAAEQLISEVSELVPKSSAEILDDVDGLGFNRSIRFDPDTSKALDDAVVQALEQDERIAEIVKSNKGARVTFVDTVAADRADSFGVVAAAAVANES